MRNRVGGNGNELGAHRHPYFSGITGNRSDERRFPPECSVTSPPKIAGGRSSWARPAIGSGLGLCHSASGRSANPGSPRRLTGQSQVEFFSMFTGIIAAVGKISRVESARGGLRLDIDAGELRLGDLKVGGS